MLTNAEVARKLIEIRLLMEMAGHPFYEYTAYEKAAASIENAPPLADLIATGEHLKLPGIGKSIGAAVEQLVRSGSAERLEELHRRFPPGVLEILNVSGIGTKTAAMLFEEHAIASLQDLEAAIGSGRLTGIPRLGPKTIENWKRGILAYKGRRRRTPLASALEIAQEAMEFVRSGPPIDRLTFAGSLRRQEVTVGDVDLVCTSKLAAEVVAHFTKWERARAVLAEGPTKASIWLPDGLQIDLRVLPDHLYGNLLQHFTGSREHNIKLREHAVRRGLRVSENGILHLESGDVTTCSEETGVYAALGMQYIPPELRSGLDEIELALGHTIPHLVEGCDLRGDFHMHTTTSDGADSPEEMIAAAAALGYEYVAISDHVRGRRGYGANQTALRKQRAGIERASARHGIRALWACEVDLLPDGTPDCPVELLRAFDMAIGSVHDAFDLDRNAMTARLIRACENPYVTLIGHPTGRRLDDPAQGYEFDYDAVFAAAARTGTAIEIDGHATRLDLPAPLIRKAKSFGVALATDSDAHRAADLRYAQLAVGQARRAGLGKEDVLNARSFAEVCAFVARKRASVATP